MTPFADRVYAVVSRIPCGRVSSYGAIAAVLGTAPRAVGQALRRNPFAPRVPCHWVVCADGRVGGFRGAVSGGAVARKVSLLRAEGVRVCDGRVPQTAFCVLTRSR